MSSTTILGGSRQQNYHEALGPMWFEPHAREIAARLALPGGAHVLEIAAGGRRRRGADAVAHACPRLHGRELNEKENGVGLISCFCVRRNMK